MSLSVCMHHSSNAYAQVTELASKLFFMISSFLVPFFATSVLVLAYFSMEHLNKQIKASSGTRNGLIRETQNIETLKALSKLLNHRHPLQSPPLTVIATITTTRRHHHYSSSPPSPPVLTLATHRPHPHHQSWSAPLTINTTHHHQHSPPSLLISRPRLNVTSPNSVRSHPRTHSHRQRRLVHDLSHSLSCLIFQSFLQFVRVSDFAISYSTGDAAADFSDAPYLPSLTPICLLLPLQEVGRFNDLAKELKQKGCSGSWKRQHKAWQRQQQA
ncbi:hypothetical protein PIB30_073899 [Stylosanthes scabra]|uniref:Uncharacterized protein n=1 Tax=Stylosanthes scabra TaxID=79078 RepID=A0ABU6RQA1_9FABA|nr:hypothetical protein [Stylosanthes scabra]